MIYLLIVLLVISFVSTYLVRQIALKRNLLDIPNERSSHTVPTPRGGGLAIVITWFMGITYLYFYHALDKNLYYANRQ